MTKNKNSKTEEATIYEDMTVSEFLGLTPEDEAWIKMKLALVSQIEEAGIKKNADDASFDLLITDLLEAGYTPSQIGKRLASVPFKKPHKSSTAKSRELARA